VLFKVTLLSTMLRTHADFFHDAFSGGPA
jgi:hypothetical protein